MVEILVPYYGDPALMKLAVSSVLDQDNDDWQLLVVDDAYPGAEVRDWLKSLNHPQVRYVRNERRLGVSGNFQKCLDLAEADLVTFLGCDDLMLPNYVAVTSRAFSEHPEVTAVHPAVKTVDANGAVTRPLADRVKRAISPRTHIPLTLSGELLAVSLLRGAWTYFPAICWRRDVVARHGFRQDLETVLDLDLLINLTLEGHELLLLPVDAFRYRRHPLSTSALTARAATRFAEESQLYGEVVARCHEVGWVRAQRAAKWHTTSRLHAALLVPGALGAREWAIARELVSHVTRRLTD